MRGMLPENPPKLQVGDLVQYKEPWGWRQGMGIIIDIEVEDGMFWWYQVKLANLMTVTFSCGDDDIEKVEE